jgi:hypothetical protein
MKEKSFAQELAALINRHGIDAKMNTNDWILADVAIDALNAYGKANQLREKMANAPEPGKDDWIARRVHCAEPYKGKPNPEGKNTENRRRSTYQKKWKQWRRSLLICSPVPKYKSNGSI